MPGSGGERDDVLFVFELRPGRRKHKTWFDLRDPCVWEYRWLLLCLLVCGLITISDLAAGYSSLSKKNRSNGEFSVGWQQVGSQARYLFGSSVSQSSSGYFVAIGANGDDAGGSNAGSVKVFGFDNYEWRAVGNPILGSPGDLAGQFVGHMERGLEKSLHLIFKTNTGFQKGTPSLMRRQEMKSHILCLCQNQAANWPSQLD